MSAELVWDKSLSVGGTCLQGYLTTNWTFQETVARLITLSGPPRSGEAIDEFKVSVEFTGMFNGDVFTLYDYKGDRELHIGGYKQLPGLPEAIRAALASVTPTPYRATERYDRRDTHSWGM